MPSEAIEDAPGDGTKRVYTERRELTNHVNPPDANATERRESRR